MGCEHRSMPGYDGAPMAGVMARSGWCLHSLFLCLYSCWGFLLPERWSLQRSHHSGTETLNTWLCGLLLHHAALGIYPAPFQPPWAARSVGW